MSSINPKKRQKPSNIVVNKSEILKKTKAATPTKKIKSDNAAKKNTTLKSKSEEEDDVIVPKVSIDEEALRIQALQEKDETKEAPLEFKDLGLKPELVEAALKMGYKLPTRIQRESIPIALEGRDLIALAQTGSGKTAAFVLPMLHHLLDSPQPFFAVIMSPTRELATQIAKHCEALGSIIGVKAAVIVGGVNPVEQAIALARKPHVIVGTPGRIAWHLKNTKGFALRNLKFLILDEADRLLQDDFEDEMDKILEVIPKERHTYLFSATMTSKVQKLERASLSDAVKVQVASKYETVDRLIQHYLLIPAKFKDCYLAYILTEHNGNSVMIFADTRKDVQRLSLVLKNLGFSALALHGQMDQSERYTSLSRFTSGQQNIIIATDVASRGLDLPKVDMVINYDIPNNAKDYIHRVGRTARGDKSGRAVALVTQYDVELYQRIELLINKQLDQYPLEEGDVMVLLERVTEAQRYAAVQMREAKTIQAEAAELEGDDDDNDDLMQGIKKRKVNHGGRGGRGGKKR